MAGKLFRYNFLYIFSFFFFFATLYHHFLQNDYSVVFSDQFYPTTITSSIANLVLRGNFPSSSFTIPSLSILMPDWEIYVIVDYSPLKPHPQDSNFYCIFDTGEETPAVSAAELPFPARWVFKCNFPTRARRSLPFKQPMLRGSSVNGYYRNSPSPELFRWTFLVYDSLTTESDVVLFVKGLNKRRGINRKPTEFNCIFGDAVRTAVTSSIQEVFRCKLPDHFAGKEPIKVSIEIVGPTPAVVPTVAYYTPPRIISSSKKAKLCACTMVYNVAKFLREWILYHSRIGVEKFILYDNGSDDDLAAIVNELIEEGYDVKTHFWLWPKTQEGGFSHSVIFAKDLCSWMMYIDVDEFVYSPSWSNLTQPSKSLLPSILPNLEDEKNVAQISIPCYEFGPSNQKEHPTTGLIQGYNCRRKTENRHKSIVLLSAVDQSLLNVIHHFKLKTEYNVKKLNVLEMVVNHYKFQVWSEFKAKFRRRVSTYVVDWTKPSNLGSNDRTPGLGYNPVEPIGWKSKFCEIYDNGLKDLTWRWFTIESLTPSEYYNRSD
ncbi:glycosyltransferase family 92 protein At1g27200-like [Solanum dulcamara]|uniref:glycosyltransferase family 92 protein At1g27200-like n=1 Tax=Solanum dulcamara TaxID=45834 RepID=UPI002485BE8C|nr:glycosyltransferase family 92 protein At1g27200-like [Solanum dulcamara]